jgi:hypothetical protein
MFSASLISMMLHSFGPDERNLFGEPPGTKPTVYPTSRELVPNLLNAISQNAGPWPTIPVVARTQRPWDRLKEFFGPFADYQPGEKKLYFWGRIPLDVLVKFFVEYHNLPFEVEYIDLGTPMREAGSGSTHDQTCDDLLKDTADPPGLAGGTPAKVGAAIIDMGKSSANPPDDYHGKLRHAVVSGVELSDHAEKVLSVLLERLKSKSVLRETTVSCALVKGPTQQLGLGRSCFDQACTPEILDAAKALQVLLSGDNIPTAINMSLGTHVGPHNGMSPLEEYVADTLTTDNRFVVVAAGNEGGLGWAAKRHVEDTDPEFLGLNTGDRCQELLVEFWWDSSTIKDLSIEADIYETLSNGRRSNHGSLPIDAKTAGTVLTTQAIGLPNTLITHSLFQSPVQHPPQSPFACIAFAMSSSSPGKNLPSLQIRFKLNALKNVVVNAWVVVAERENPLTTFLEGGSEGSITVPASEAAALSVAGLKSATKMWEGSSRGPAAQYDSAVTEGSPSMAHLAELGSEFGTSFASPRACGDVVKTLSDPHKQQNCTDVLALLTETYGLPKNPAWNRRFGYCKQS